MVRPGEQCISSKTTGLTRKRTGKCAADTYPGMNRGIAPCPLILSCRDVELPFSSGSVELMREKGCPDVSLQGEIWQHSVDTNRPVREEPGTMPAASEAD